MSDHVVLRDFFMKKQDCIGEWTVEEVVLFHSIIHQSFSIKETEVLESTHVMVVKELEKRGRKHLLYDGLDELKKGEGC